MIVHMLKIFKINNSNESKNEWITLSVVSDGNFQWYAFVDETFSEEDKPSNIFKHFAFPNFSVKKVERARLVTGTGTNQSRVLIMHRN